MKIKGSSAYFRAHASHAELYGPRPRALAIADVLVCLIVQLGEKNNRFKLRQVAVVGRRYEECWGGKKV